MMIHYQKIEEVKNKERIINQLTMYMLIFYLFMKFKNKEDVEEIWPVYHYHMINNE